jgi:hypothetical protein
MTGRTIPGGTAPWSPPVPSDFAMRDLPPVDPFTPAWQLRVMIDAAEQALITALPEQVERITAKLQELRDVLAVVEGQAAP